MTNPKPSAKTPGPIRRFFSLLGPGLVTGAADDDPSGIVTYSIAGAQLGTAMLWTALLTFPLMAAVQMMCARIGMVTGAGLTPNLRRKFPRPLLVLMALALFAANTVNVGADLSGMAEAASVLTHLTAGFFVLVFGGAIIAATVWVRYNAFASILKWLAISLFAYIITAFIMRPHWGTVLRATFLPSWPKGHAEWSTLVAILGTTISPYLFFWQASQEVEVEKARGQKSLRSRLNAPEAELRERAIDVGTGAFFSNLIMYFIILTAALTLHAGGVTDIASSRDAIRALAPVAGPFAAWLYAAGIIGVGFLAIPTLAGSAAYVFADLFRLRQGLDERLERARAFYGILVLSILFGMALTFAPVRPVDALFLSAVINGLLAPFLLAAILWVAADGRLMRGQPSSWLACGAVALTTLGMFAAAIGLFL